MEEFVFKNFSLPTMSETPSGKIGVSVSYPQFDGHLKEGTNNPEEVFDGEAQEVHTGV
jgi:hypothetical protein